MRKAIIASNVQVHGHLFAVDNLVARFKRQGLSANWAFKLACQLVFNRVRT